MRRLLIFILLSGIVCCQETPPRVNLGDLGVIEGKVVKTVGNKTIPPKTYYSFRNIPYAVPITQETRFSQPKLYNQKLPGDVYDASKTGPLCPQMSLDPTEIEILVSTPVSALIDSSLGAGLSLVLIPILEILFPTQFTGKTVGQVLEDWLDITLSVSEDCLHLAVSTPNLPSQSGSTDELLPVMFFVHGGAFYAGTQMKMDATRLGHVADVVVVGVNYRVGPLGFLCLDTEEASGNMGMLDMVVALQWVQKYIHLFGGDPNKVTIFGESAGSASIGHLLLSNLTQGLFHRAIGQSGSAVSPWAFDFEPEFHARRIAKKLDCDLPLQDDLVQCLKNKTTTEITTAHSQYVKEERASGTMGFGGSIPCSQTKGEQVFYYEGQHPEQLLVTGEYVKLPIFFGANSYEGSFVYGTVYNDFVLPNYDMVSDSEFLKHDFVEFLLSVVGVTQSYAFSDSITEKYFYPSQLGSLEDMLYGAMDIMGVFFIKASGYKMVQENSYHANSFWYSIEHKTKKSAFHLLFPFKKPPIADPGVSHADELFYIFNVDLPILLCDIGPQLDAIIQVVVDCKLNMTCLADPQGPLRPDGPFMTNHGDCLYGHLTEQEQIWSDRLVKAWTNFAIYGTPTVNETQSDDELPYLAPWSRENPNYMRFGSEGVTIENDYRRTYNFALRENSPETTTTTTTTSTSTTTTSSSGASLSPVAIFLVLASMFGLKCFVPEII